jgi:uncharacterized integral membrane protein (TIGR00697 family)
METNQISINAKLLFLLGFFVSMLVGMNLLGGKIIPFLGLSTSVSLFMIPITFLITDIVAEVYGRKMAESFVWIGVISLAVITAFVALFVWLPAHERFIYDSDYRNIFGISIRFLVASIVAFVISQIHDIWAFEFWKKKTKGRWLWLRNNASTVISQGLDTLIFMFIAFYGITPEFNTLFIIELSIPYYVFRIGFALIDTPFVYLGVRWLKGKEGVISPN